MKLFLYLFAVFVLPGSILGTEPDPIALWADGAPGSEGKTAAERIEKTASGSLKVYSIHNPTITPYLPNREAASGAAVVIFPGGGHRELNVSSEGYDIARWLSQHGVAGFVVKYRLAREPGSTYRMDVHAFADTQRAIRLVRSRAKEWGIDPARVGVLGFSAGGELAAMAAMSPEDLTDAADPVDKLSARPSFQALVYPGTPRRIVPAKDAPPAFLAVGFKDATSTGLAQAYLRFHEVGVPAELHIYAAAGHPSGFRPADNTPASKWRDRFYEWLDDRGFLTPKAP